MESSPSDSQTSIAQAEDPPIADPTIINPAPTSLGELGNDDINTHYVQPEVKGIQHLSRKSRKATKSTLQPFEGWEQPPAENREPYHEYVHELVQAGWDNLKTLDDYMSKDIEDQDLVMSVLDITDDHQRKQWPDIHDYTLLKKFIDEQSRTGVKVRLYMAEQRGPLSAGVMEAFGSSLDLDPRFFQWSIKGNKHVLEPSARHRAPYTNIGFGVPKLSTPLRTDAERFKVTIYVKPDDVGNGWTGVFLFSSHSKMALSSRNLISPPNFNSPRPAPTPLSPKSFREIYLETFAYLDLAHATVSPFYAISYLLRLNCLCWDKVITNIRDEDRRINGVSDTTVGHVEEIQRSLSVVQRGGSLGWAGGESKLTEETRKALEEDFKHLVEQTDLLWVTRDKMAATRRQKSETRWTTLTNTFTYVYTLLLLIHLWIFAC